MNLVFSVRARALQTCNIQIPQRLTSFKNSRLNFCLLITSKFSTFPIATMDKKDDILAWASKDGEFRRKPSVFRNSVARGTEYEPDKGRYHLFISWACPWAHRTAIVRELKGLQDVISMSAVDWLLGPMGWKFSSPEETPGANEDPFYNFEFIRQYYFKVNPDYEGRFTVPVLWDTKTESIVNNESSEIIRMFNEEFDDFIDEKYRGITYYPENLRVEIDELNEWVYDTVNNGVYKSGFATTQTAYETHCIKLFKSLDRLEEILGKSSGPFLFGDTLTEADIRLYTTIIRFDPVYVQHFKCNLGTIRADYPNLHTWVRHLYWDYPAFKNTTNFEHIKKHYTKSHKQINPFSITPIGPAGNILPK
ncbi:glutathione S-transferase [Lipomyces oligophaga]|uniref:glutathione S-transferase n=1 Tax=Lipomyces oligophaga TaxID=45792 RepID=UPI0034CD3727